MLTDTKIRSAKKKEKPYRLTDSKGLYIHVSISESKNWYVHYILNGKESQVVIGSYPDMTLAEARIKRDEVKKTIKLGFNLIFEKEMVFYPRIIFTKNILKPLLRI